MKYNFKKTFDAVNMHPEHQERIRTKLSSHVIEKQKGDYILNNKAYIRKKPRVAVIVAASLAFVLLVGFTFGGQIIQLLGGGRILSGTDDNGNDYVTMDTGFDTDPAETRDGQVFFILDGSDTDITSYCSDKTYYQYELIADNGHRHVVIIGGTSDNLGWAEFVWDENGIFVGSNATYKGEQEPIWLELGREFFSIE